MEIKVIFGRGGYPLAEMRKICDSLYELGWKRSRTYSRTGVPDTVAAVAFSCSSIGIPKLPDDLKYEVIQE